MKNIFCALTGLLLLVGCGSPQKHLHPFVAGEPLRINASTIEPVLGQPVSFTDLKGRTFVDKKFEEALNLWVVSTLIPASDAGTLVLTFEKATLVETPMKPQKKGVDAVFSKEPTSKLDAIIKLRTDLKDATGNTIASGHFLVERTTTFLEDNPLEYREEKTAQLVQDLLSDLDKQVRLATSEGVANILVSSNMPANPSGMLVQ